MTRTPARGANAARSGGAFERSFGAYIKGHERYAVESQVRVPKGKPDGRLCIIDTVVHDRKAAERIVVSCKSQTSQGSVEEKMIYELYQLSHLVGSNYCHRAYMVLLGSGFSGFRRFIMSPQFRIYCPKLAWGQSWDGVEILGIDINFIRLC